MTIHSVVVQIFQGGSTVQTDTAHKRCCYGSESGALLRGGDDLEAEPPLDVLAWFDRAQPEVFHHHRQRVLQKHNRRLISSLITQHNTNIKQLFFPDKTFFPGSWKPHSTSPLDIYTHWCQAENWKWATQASALGRASDWVLRYQQRSVRIIKMLKTSNNPSITVALNLLEPASPRGKTDSWRIYELALSFFW